MRQTDGGAVSREALPRQAGVLAQLVLQPMHRRERLEYSRMSNQKSSFMWNGVLAKRRASFGESGLELAKTSENTGAAPSVQCAGSMGKWAETIIDNPAPGTLNISRDSNTLFGHDRLPGIPGNHWHLALERADYVELRMVRRLAAMTRFRAVRSTAIAVNHLGNGWIYALIAAGLLLSGTANAAAIATSAILATAISHALYAYIKRSIARRRPFEKDPNLKSLGGVLDRYSFPSGHCMTLTAVLAPITLSLPQYWPGAAVALCLLAWSRLAAAHHYSSDILAGICLGAFVAVPIALWLLPFGVNV